MNPTGEKDDRVKAKLGFPRFRHFEPMMMIVMVLGIVALCQPWNLFLHRYGLTIIIIGLIGFIVVSHMPTSSEDSDG